jgi:hypothetical protein
VGHLLTCFLRDQRFLFCRYLLISGAKEVASKKDHGFGPSSNGSRCGWLGARRRDSRSHKTVQGSNAFSSRALVTAKFGGKRLPLSSVTDERFFFASPCVCAGEKKAPTINSELWHACAGPLVSLPPAGSLVVYFPQGHSEQVSSHLPAQLFSAKCRFMVPWVPTFFCDLWEWFTNDFISADLVSSFGTALFWR